MSVMISLMYKIVGWWWWCFNRWLDDCWMYSRFYITASCDVHFIVWAWVLGFLHISIICFMYFLCVMYLMFKSVCVLPGCKTHFPLEVMGHCSFCIEVTKVQASSPFCSWVLETQDASMSLYCQRNLTSSHVQSPPCIYTKHSLCCINTMYLITSPYPE